MYTNNTFQKETSVDCKRSKSIYIYLGNGNLYKSITQHGAILRAHTMFARVVRAKKRPISHVQSLEASRKGWELGLRASQVFHCQPTTEWPKTALSEPTSEADAELVKALIVCVASYIYKYAYTYNTSRDLRL